MPSGGAGRNQGRKSVENKKVTACFRVDPVAYKKAKVIHGKELSKKVNELIIELSKTNTKSYEEVNHS